MISHTRRLMIVAAASVVLFAGAAARAEDEFHQSYTEWKLHSSKKYYWCEYHFSPKEGQNKMQYVVWYPTKKDYQYVYYYNTDKEVYWCRAANHYHPQYNASNPLWNVLADGQKQQQLSKIKKWPDKAIVPPVPGAVASSQMLPAPPPPALAAK